MPVYNYAQPGRSLKEVSKRARGSTRTTHLFFLLTLACLCVRSGLVASDMAVVDALRVFGEVTRITSFASQRGARSPTSPQDPTKPPAGYHKFCRFREPIPSPRYHAARLRWWR